MVLCGSLPSRRYRGIYHDIGKQELRFISCHKPLEGVLLPESPPRVLHDQTFMKCFVTLWTQKNMFELSVLLLSFAWYSRARACHTSMIYAHTFFPERSWSWISTKSATPPDTALAGMLPPPNSSASDSDAAARALLAGREETWRAMK